MGALKNAWTNYRDESFIEQFLSPRLMRDMHMFQLHDSAGEPVLKVAAIHDEMGYRGIRSALARQYDVGVCDANIQVMDADLKGDRTLHIKHRMHRGVPLHEGMREHVCAHIERLWGHDVVLTEADAEE
jgi:spore cortex formation protein SpoVR/YcgB (stage V sporulation)